MDATTTRSPVAFAASPMTRLLDRPVRYDLAESTCPALRLDEIAAWDELGSLDLGYPTSQGSTSVRRRIAADHGVECDDVLLTTGSAGAMHLLAQDRCHGRTLLLTPCYPPARLVPEGLGSPVDEVRVRFDDGYRMRLDDVAEALTPETTLVSLASPQNPSGVRFDDGELMALVRLVADRAPEAVVLVDETYRASTYGAYPVPRSAARLSPRIAVCSSLSKAHGAPGLRFGWLVTSDPVLAHRLRAAKFAGMVASPRIDEELADRLLARQDAVLRPRARFLGERLAELVRWTEAQPVELLRPHGGALCCLRLPEAFGPSAIAAFHTELAARDTRVAPGSWFGEDDRVFRLGFGHLAAGDYTEALARLGAAIDVAGGV
ncbi:MAG TPA: pyridoxal phosphate-dependent aminotransferase [Nocardioides sp.]|uniref:pyridoxal phosphate-dependent aminotransferase n=1 Tax=Nocardioides sp. TaxID=35761 RepID=UPI002E34B9D9|nr:pyridoxal phosphate-dependent aminotransferase [Nocardioides sp.]HEX5090533.1 pyridoxal phosphate-dependent aminotransferase [Nocardioides sp.]